MRCYKSGASAAQAEAVVRVVKELAVMAVMGASRERLTESRQSVTIDPSRLRRFPAFRSYG